MRPAAIVYAAAAVGDQEVKTVIEYAAAKGIAVAIRTGGHHYTGSSSTTGANIQLDLSETYTDFDTATADLAEPARGAPAALGLDAEPDSGIIKVGVSLALQDLNAALGARHVFMPHGQCSRVHVGGHSQTGGYGQLSRTAGLFSDHIVAVRMFTLDPSTGFTTCSPRIVRRGSDDPAEAALFFGVMGGRWGGLGRGGGAIGKLFVMVVVVVELL